MNTIIDKLPVELHIPTYNYCGPGTQLAKCLARKDEPKKLLDSFCQEHDISYALFKDDSSRKVADQELQGKAIQRFKAKDASISEKVAALRVAGAMKVKAALGMGLKKTQPKTKTTKTKKIKQIKGGAVKTNRTKRRKQRVVTIAKRGGFLTLLLPTLRALGVLGGGAAGIAKAVNDSKANQVQLAEQKRHNLAMEQATKGKGHYLKPYTGFGNKASQGKGMYLAPFQKK